MNLSELELVPPKEVVNVQTDEEEDYGDDPEVDLQNALLLLRDAGELLGVIGRKEKIKWPNIINLYVGRQIMKLGQEIEAFLNDFDMTDGDNTSGNAA